MEFGSEKCTMLITKSWKIQTTEVTEIPNQESKRTLGKIENYNYMRILEADTIKQMEMKDKKRLPQKNQETSQNWSLP